MLNKISLLLCLLIFQLRLVAQSDLPIDTLAGKDASKPLLFYITGDGGFNSFSTSFMQQWNRNGYPVIALNARSYFWKKKQPEVAATDISALLTDYMNKWHRNEIIFAGYSLGADVLSFIQTRLPATIANKIKHTVLLSPSNTTDFTVHLFYNSNGSDVPAEINKLNKPVLVIFGKEETDIPAAKISNKSATVITVPGDHHYDNQVQLLMAEIIKRM